MMANRDINTPPNDCIVVQTDFAFDIVNKLITQLYNDQELKLQSVQNVQIENIRSNNPQEDSSFGSMQCFARTASSVLRMCMLRSANVPEDLYPKLGLHSMRRNKARMSYSSTYGNEFVLTTNKDRAREYFSYYDHLYPHFKIEDQLCTARPNQWKIIPGTMMLIFRGNFSEIIAFNTSLQVKYCPNYQNIGGFPKDIGGCYESFAHVICQVRRICDPDHVCVKVLRLMKGGHWSIDVILRHLSEVKWVKEEMQPIAMQPQMPTPTQLQMPTPMQPQMPTSTHLQMPTSMQPQMPTPTQPQMPTSTQPQMPTSTHLQMPTSMQPQMPTPTQPQMPTSMQPKMPTSMQPRMPTLKQPQMPTSTQPQMPTPTQPQMPTSTQPQMPTPTQPQMPTSTQPRMPTSMQPRMPTLIQSQMSTQPQMPTPTQPQMPTPTQPQMPTPTQPQMPTSTQPRMPTPMQPRMPTSMQPQMPTSIQPQMSTQPQMPTSTQPQMPTSMQPRMPMPMQSQMPTSMQPQMPTSMQPGVVRSQNQLSQNQYGQPQAPLQFSQNGLGGQFASLHIGQPNRYQNNHN